MQRASLRGAALQSASCMPIRLSIKWARTNRSTSLRKLRGGRRTACTFIRPFVNGNHHDPCFILNMDQMPVYFLMNCKRTLELIGKKTIHIRTLTNDTKRVAVVVTIAGDGTVLPFVVVFKGKAMATSRRRSLQCSPHPITNTVRMPHGWKRPSCWHGLTRSSGRISR